MNPPASPPVPPASNALALVRLGAGPFRAEYDPINDLLDLERRLNVQVERALRALLDAGVEIHHIRLAAGPVRLDDDREMLYRRIEVLTGEVWRPVYDFVIRF